jgi:hypothetical protein
MAFTGRAPGVKWSALAGAALRAADDLAAKQQEDDNLQASR